MPRRLAGPSNDYNSALLRLTVLQALNDGRGQGYLDGIVAADGNTLMGSSLIQKEYQTIPGQSQYFRPRHYICRTNVVDLIFIDGIQDRADGNVVWSNYCNSLNATANLVSNQQGLQFSNAAEWVWSNYSKLGISRPLVICGYSYGGAIARWVDAIGFQQFGNGQRQTCVTFGAPKFFGTGFGPVNGTDDFRRWMLSDDAVPLFPPALNLIQAFAYGVNNFQLANLLRYSDAIGGLQVQLDGRISAVSSPTQTGPDPVAALQSWLSATSRSQATPHSLSTYIARFASAGARLDPAELPYEPDTGSGGMGGGGDYDAANTVTPAVLSSPVAASEIQSIQRTSYNTLSATINGRSNQTPIIPDDRLWHAVRRGRTWYVAFNGQTIIAAPHRRGARSLAATGNLLMRKLQVKAALDPDRMIQAFTDYLAIASDQGEGFSPPATYIAISD